LAKYSRNATALLLHKPKNEMKKKTFRKLEVLLHFITAFILIIKGVDEMSRRLYFPGAIILGLAMVILCITIFWKTLYITPKQARQVCYYLEAPALLITSYVLYLENKPFLPDIFLVAALFYPVVGFLTSKKSKRFEKHHL
jgi:membrane protein YdbS with pleckstrin-like domain